MKKFYEKPIVEITEFDRECIMTGSVITSNMTDEQRGDTARALAQAAAGAGSTAVGAMAANMEGEETTVFGW